MNTSKLQSQLQQVLKRMLALRIPLFLLLVAAVYAFVIWRINVLQQVQPNLNAVNSKLQATPHVDQSTIAKIQQLQNNSVNAQALFNQARQNPFQE